MIAAPQPFACPLCNPGLGPILAESSSWRLVVNRNQNLLSTCFLALRRHEEAVTGLTAEEWQDVQHELQRATKALQHAFQPDHFNVRVAAEPRPACPSAPVPPLRGITFVRRT